ncbi:F-box-like domain superfamily [Sesbania bispinosa]|nr:F-box-like domain superfamily [Sesbania bispinosa]
MSEADSTISKTTCILDWSNLPQDLLSKIANGLELIDFLSFSGVCKDWRNASLKALSEDKSFGYDPWFLMYDGEGPQCTLLSNHEKIYSINFQELDGATCLASSGGWLLLFCRGSIFFFCPFSRAKIDLPDCPFTELSDHVASFSSIPTCQDCIVVVLCRRNNNELELHLLFRGDDKWTKHNFYYHRLGFTAITAAVFIEGEFHFMGGKHGLVTFDAADTKQFNKYVVVSPADVSVADETSYLICHDMFRANDMMTKLGLGANVSISTCGTLIPPVDMEHDLIIQNESIQATSESEVRYLKGVWFLPRYHIPQNQNW